MEYDGWLHINLYHAIDKDLPNKFTPRGNVTISSLNSGSFTIVQDPLSNNERIKLKVGSGYCFNGNYVIYSDFILNRNWQRVTASTD